jgi:putative transposase
MKLLFLLLGHLLVTLARLASPGGLRSVVAESLAVKHQLLIMKRSKRRSPNLRPWDRLLLGFYTLLVSPKRLRKMAVITKPSTLLRLHYALVKCKYHLLYSSQRPRRPGPKGSSRELIAAVVEMKRRNPRMGCRKIAEQISNAFGFAINKDVVRRILIQHYRPAPGGAGPSWLSVIGQARDSLWSVELFRCESICSKLLGHGGDGHLHSPDHRLCRRRRQSRRTSVCRMFNRAIARQSMPKHLSSDHDPLFRFQRWLANLRILEIDEIKSIPETPRSHAFIVRLIGTIRHEFLDQTLFWNQGDLERKLDSYEVYYNRYRCHTGLAGITPARRGGAPADPFASLDSYRWRKHCNGLFQTPAAA